jgi:predicted PurR-regulated permease PerM
MAEASEVVAIGSSPVEALYPPSGIKVRNIAFTLLSIGIVTLLLQFMQPVLIPLVLGGLLFYALDPAVDRLQAWRVPRVLGAALMLTVVVAGCGLLPYTLQGQARTVVDELPAGARKLAASFHTARGAQSGAIEKVQQAADLIQRSHPAPTPAVVTRVQIEQPGFQASAFVWATSMRLASATNQWS